MSTDELDCISQDRRFVSSVRKSKSSQKTNTASILTCLSFSGSRQIIMKMTYDSLKVDALLRHGASWCTWLALEYDSCCMSRVQPLQPLFRNVMNQCADEQMRRGRRRRLESCQLSDFCCTHHGSGWADGAAGHCCQNGARMC